MDADQMAVTLAGVLAIAGVLAYFFAGTRR
jgi:hypothetical protein